MQGQHGQSSLQKWLLTAAKWLPLIVLERRGRFRIKLFSPKALFYGRHSQSILIEVNDVRGSLKGQAGSSHYDTEPGTVSAT